MRSHQETFDIVAEHLLLQGKKALSHNVCRYRAPDGTKCAAGVLIPDDKYVIDIEGAPADGVRVSKILLEEGHDPEFVVKLQRLHDSSYIEPNEWFPALYAFAVVQDLHIDNLIEAREAALAAK